MVGAQTSARRAAARVPRVPRAPAGTCCDTSFFGSIRVATRSCAARIIAAHASAPVGRAARARARRAVRAAARARCPETQLTNQASRPRGIARVERAATREARRWTHLRCVAGELPTRPAQAAREAAELGTEYAEVGREGTFWSVTKYAPA